LIRVLTRSAIADASPWRWLLHPDPEQLADLERSLSQPSREAEERIAQFSSVVSSIRVGAIHKLTRPGRLRECDRVLAEAVETRGLDELRFLDIGASDGTTTLDTVRTLAEQLARPVRATLIDRYLRLLRYGNGPLREYRSPDGSPVMLRLGRVGLQLSSIESTRDPVSRWLGRCYLRRTQLRERLPLTATLDLVSPAVRQAGIGLLEANILERQAALAGAFDAIRASNVLNLDYFSTSELEQALRHIHAYLSPDGILVLSRNHLEEGGIERGSAWRRTAAGFARLCDFRGGSYLASVVDALRITEPRAEGT
jgi:SAM-dependent methyltransferase